MAAMEKIRREVPGALIELLQLDLGDQASIRSCVERFHLARLDLLVNNAGVAMLPLTRTLDGFESHFGINHLGTFALTGRLLPKLLAAEAPRVVTVSSEGQRFARVDLRNLNAERGFNTIGAYLQSKRANLYFAAELQRLASTRTTRLRSMVIAPGLTRTHVLMGSAHRARGLLYQGFVSTLMRLFFRPVLEGAKTTLFAATCPDLPGGSYVVPGGVFQLRGPPRLRTQERALEHVEEMRDLWRISETLTGVHFRFSNHSQARVRSVDLAEMEATT